MSYNTSHTLSLQETPSTWGRIRNTDATYDNAVLQVTNRGYTCHEHLLTVELVNMNGRMYDPLLGRMLSPDNYTQAVDMTQNYNRYSYALNNPLMYSDPSGDVIFTSLAIITGQWWALPMAIGADIGMWQGGSLANGTANPFQWDYSSGKTWGYMAGGAVIGGTSGLAGGTVASGIGQQGFLYSGLLGTAAGGAVGGTISGGGFAALGGGDIGEGMWKGAISGLAGGVIGGYIGGGTGAFIGGATSGAVGTALYGGDFDDIGKSALLGGVIGWGGYHFQKGIAYHQYKNTGGEWTYKQYSKISTWSQRSFARGREVSIKIDQTGKVKFDKWGPRYTSNGGTVSQSVRTTDQEAIHSHAQLGSGFSYDPSGQRGDIAAYQKYFYANPQSKLQFSVVGKYSIYTTNISGAIYNVNSPAYTFPYFTYYFGH